MLGGSVTSDIASGTVLRLQDAIVSIQDIDPVDGCRPASLPERRRPGWICDLYRNASEHASTKLGWR